MQKSAKRLIRICEEKLPLGKPLNSFDVRVLREALEFAAKVLDQDSLFLQIELDDAKKVYVEDDFSSISGFTWPESPLYHTLKTSCLENTMKSPGASNTTQTRCLVTPTRLKKIWHVMV